MADVNVLVVFYSRCGQAEQLALAAGVGAIQAEANIRLRRVSDDVDRAVIEADAAWSAALTRMNRDYVSPRPADPVWADVIVLATPAASADELTAYVASLTALGPMAGKLAAPLAPPMPGDETPGVNAICVAAARAGLIVVAGSSLDGEGDPAARARALGQRVTHMARMLKPPPPTS